jgi:hypothetical protein
MAHDWLAALERESCNYLATLDADPLLGRVIDGSATRETYVRFLSATYQYVRVSGFLLAKTAEGLRRSRRCSWLVSLAAAKAMEEAPHDDWALRDLRRCGENVELLKGAPPTRAVEAYVQYNLALAESGSPAFLGTAYTLEYISQHRAGRAAENLARSAVISGVGDALSFLRSHGEADQDHMAALTQALQRVEDEQDRSAILLSAAVTRALYPRFFQEAA